MYILTITLDIHGCPTYMLSKLREKTIDNI